VKATRRVGNDPSELSPALDWLEAALQGASVGGPIVGDLRLAAEEALSNVVQYAHADAGRHWIEFTVEVGNGEIRLVLRDDGRPFNPLEAPAPDLDAPIEERPRGGLGIHLLKSLVDRIDYERENDVNVLCMVKRL
jgi:anti-sigma regulatory factor (Ser/Thr protein kinase)